MESYNMNVFKYIQPKADQSYEKPREMTLKYEVK